MRAQADPPWRPRPIELSRLSFALCSIRVGIAEPGHGGIRSGTPAAEVSTPRVVPACRKDETATEIVICGKPLERSPYRLPPQQHRGFDPEGPVMSVSRERNALLEHGDTGIHSCSTTGPGGWTGCDLKVIKRAEQQGRRVGVGSRGTSVGIQVGKQWAGWRRD